MEAAFEEFLKDHSAEIVREADGSLCRDMHPRRSPACERILAEILADERLVKPDADGHPHSRLSKWVMKASRDQRVAADLGIEIPPSDIHFVPGQYRIFYDFKNTDMVFDELQAAGIAIKGTLLDFGCSSGRNLAVLRRAFGSELELFGADPAQASIDWLNENVKGASAVVSNQNPPLPFDDGQFDIVIAKSIWTHFSSSAGRRWLAEMQRILKKGGHFLFSTHGPHDVASRILLDIPSPRYDRYTGHEKWTRDGFLLDLVETYQDKGYYFQAFKEVGYQPDLHLIENADTADWGLMFVSPDYLKTMLPEGLSIVSRSVGRTGNRHDLYIVRRD